MNILFICKYNRFRSKLAEAFLKKHSKHKAKSAGIIKGPPLDKKIIQCAKDNNIKINHKIQTLNIPLIKWQDQIIIVADDVPKSIFSQNPETYGKKLKVIHWKIKDTDSKLPSTLNKLAKKIENKVLTYIA